MKIIKITSILLYVALLLCGAIIVQSCSGESSDREEETVSPAISTKRERNSIKEGNKLYEQQRYAEAEVAYKKALQENPDNSVAQFNLASSYLKQRGEDLTNKQDSLVRTADAMLAKVAQSSELAEPSFYDRGNVAYKGEDYAAAIEMYKNALRRNPENNQARENLRLAQLKKQEQDQQQDQNQDQQDQENQDDQQNQDQQQNEDQNQQDQQDQQDQNEDQQENQQNKQDQQDQKNQDQKQQQGGLSDASAQQILKAMEDKENGTRQKVELMKQNEEKRANRRKTDKPW
ncbi:MAG: tetratricopeptide repeat protein [Bacteroidales bacterium]|nr:tetratricopeptide repeat protein [Bacteroidales bacterium]